MATCTFSEIMFVVPVGSYETLSIGILRTLVRVIYTTSLTFGLIDVGLMDFAGGLPLNWWEDNHGGAEKEESSTNRDLAAATVLAEYVAAVSRPQEWVRRRGTDSPRQVDSEQGRESNLTRARRAAARSVPPIAEATLYNSIGMNDTVGIYLSGCGHAVHQDCRDRYFSSLLQRCGCICFWSLRNTKPCFH